ncbi:MAG: response regulator [Spirochaetaceae bacterium]|jgi:DNA-binding response OmpR family regulator|nr:response regulator [Spirochaetaceae bacterium]
MPKRKTIIIADNEEPNLELIDIMLSKLGFEIEKTTDGKNALEKIKQKKFDLALINTILPKVSGWEILREIKSNADLSEMQVILLTDIENVKEKAESYDLGAEDYITKPFNFSILAAKIRSVLRNKDFYINMGKLYAEKHNGN